MGVRSSASPQEGVQIQPATSRRGGGEGDQAISLTPGPGVLFLVGLVPSGQGETRPTQKRIIHRAVSEILSSKNRPSFDQFGPPRAEN